MKLNDVSLDDKFLLTEGRIFLNGTQALVRLPLIQQLIDQRNNLNTAGYISGYRGSPLGQYDQQLWKANKYLKNRNIEFNPGLNEDLAATAVWGTQQIGLHGKPKFDGVFSIWYGKGPGVDRSGDVFRHGNLAGTHKNGGVIALMGDDHTCESSTTAHQSEYAFVDAMMPILNPAGIEELLQYGIYGWSLSRFSGCWVGIKCMKDTIDSTATVRVDVNTFLPKTPNNYSFPKNGLNIMWPDSALDQEHRLHNYKLKAAQDFVRENKLDKVIYDSNSPQIGIITCGKSFMDVMQAFQYLGLDKNLIKDYGIKLYKIALTWPIDPVGLLEFTKNLKKIIIVEEKRGLVETQVKEILYNVNNSPEVVGKKDEKGEILFKSNGSLSANEIALAIGKRLLSFKNTKELSYNYNKLLEIQKKPLFKPSLERTPYFCSGCPHNTGTKVPEGSVALSGIGCHFMSQWMNRNTIGYTQMGGEGAGWLGEAPFIDTDHVFQNIGDGTYFHSGILAIRASVAAGINVTYKILFNDAVAMTGGQPVEGSLTVPQVTQQLYGEKVKKIVVVSDDIEKYKNNSDFAPGVKIFHRDQFDMVQKKIREIKGTTAIVYDQTCGAEKRRRRKRKEYPDPLKRVFINELVCEGCGDCGAKSNCISVLPYETELGRKRKIDQSACNKDFSCVKGFCPSFITVEGAELKAVEIKQTNTEILNKMVLDLKEPESPKIDKSFKILVNGVGGTGIVTIGAILGMAAHLEGKSFSGLDMAGLAQKGGAVWSHLQIAEDDSNIKTVRLGLSSANLLIGGDLVVSASNESIGITRQSAFAVINDYQQITGAFTSNPDYKFPKKNLKQTIKDNLSSEKVNFINSTRFANLLLGNSIASNMFILGYAYQKGHLPLTSSSILKAIRLNGVSVEMNVSAFNYGRLAGDNQDSIEKFLVASLEDSSHKQINKKNFLLEEIINYRKNYLENYQNKKYAEKYVNLVTHVKNYEDKIGSTSLKLTRSVALYYFKLLAYKDEYEVARLNSSKEIMEKLKKQFKKGFKLTFHLAPPIFSKKNPETGELIKSEYGMWMLYVFKILKKFKFLRGTKYDFFGYTKERKVERKLISDYEKDLKFILKHLCFQNLDVAVEILSLPEIIRGFGHVKEKNLIIAESKKRKLLKDFKDKNLTSVKSAA